MFTDVPVYTLGANNYLLSKSLFILGCKEHYTEYT